MTFKQLVAKIMADPKFRAKLVKNPATALKSAGVKATPEMVAALKGVNFSSLARVAATFSKGVGPDTGIT